MELRQLREFVTLAEELHYARAAARLGIDQSPLSRRIKEFEQDLGVLLFARTSRSTQLTQRGELLLQWARSIIAATAQAEAVVRSDSPARKVLHIALCDDVPTQDLFPALANFQRSHSEVEIHTVERTCEQQAKEIEAGLVDVGFGLFLAATAEIHVRPLWNGYAHAVIRIDHALATAPEIGAAQIRDARIGVIERAATVPNLRAHLEALAHSVGTNVHIANAESLKVLLSMVMAGTCVGIIGPAHAEMIQLVDFAIKPIRHARAHFVTRVAWRATEARPIALKLIDAVCKAATAAREAPSGMRGLAP